MCCSSSVSTKSVIRNGGIRGRVNRIVAIFSLGIFYSVNEELLIPGNIVRFSAVQGLIKSCVEFIEKDHRAAAKLRNETRIRQLHQTRNELKVNCYDREYIKILKNNLINSFTSIS